jgi:serine/threonine-protein kinase RsbW
MELPTPPAPIIVDGTLDALDPITEFLLKAAKTAGLDKKSTYKLRLAIDEIATNIALHGYEETGMIGSIWIFCEITSDELTIILEDIAIAYNPLERPNITEEELAKPLEEREIGGLGVFLTLRGVDRFSYEYKDGRNRNIFTMSRPKPETSSEG